MIGTDLDIPTGVDLQMVLSIFLLSYAFGPFFLASFSETWGRRPVLMFGNLIYIIFTLCCGFATTGTQIKIFRFLAGIGGSASLGVSRLPFQELTKHD
jgi:MFS family permease